MKKFSYLMAAFLIAMTGCQKEPQATTGDEIAAGEKVYMKFKIQAVDTRSATDETAQTPGNSNSDASPDFEVGKDYENTISTVDIVLRNEDKFIVASSVVPTKNEENSWLATFNSGNIAAGEEYKVYIYANCSANQNLDFVSNATIDSMTEEHKFWMTNAYQAQTITVPALSTNQATPTDLGSHFVERSMARFDYMETKNNNAYEFDGITVTLTEAAIINQSKQFYLLRHATVSGNSTNNSNVVVGYPEIASNYVVDTDWEAKLAAFTNSNYDGIASNFDYSLNDYPNWPWTPLNTLSKDDEWTGTNHESNDYKIFGYVKENTLPDENSQVNGMSTGIVFKGMITGTVVTEADGAAIYMFDGTLYGTWDKVVAAAQSSEVLKYYVDKFDTTIEDNEHEDLASAGFTRYTADANGDYYTYYYYWNRHNDNGEPQDMGPMEFAVVRNNVYKLCVDYISKLGHPTPGTPDPDPVDPDDPDEQGEYFFSVSVKVVPWVVRVNHIGW